MHHHELTQFRSFWAIEVVWEIAFFLVGTVIVEDHAVWTQFFRIFSIATNECHLILELLSICVGAVIFFFYLHA